MDPLKFVMWLAQLGGGLALMFAVDDPMAHQMGAGMVGSALGQAQPQPQGTAERGSALGQAGLGFTALAAADGPVGLLGAGALGNAIGLHLPSPWGSR